MNLHPFYECIKACEEHIAKGYTVYQEFNCAYCGAKQGVEEANTFYRTATCGECGETTNIEKDGMNYCLVATRLPRR